MAAIFRRRWPRTPVVRTPTRRFMLGKEGPHFTTARVAVATEGRMACAPAAPPWDPSMLTGVVAWWDASDTATITSSGSPAKVSQWDSKIVTAPSFTQATSTNQPTTGVATINGLNVITPDANTWMHAVGFGTSFSSNTGSFLAVFLPTASTPGTRVLSVVGGGATDFANNTAAAAISVTGGSPSVTNFYINGTQSSGALTNGVVNAVANVRNAGTFDTYVDGVTGTGATTGTTTNWGVDRALIGAYSDQLSSLLGFDTGFRICEIVATSAVLTPAERASWFTYANLKWQGGTPSVCNITQRQPTARQHIAVAPRMAGSESFNASHWGTVIGEYDFSDTSTITHSSGAVSDVAPKSGSTNHITATGANRPTTGTRTSPTGLNVVDFDGTDDLLIAGFVGASQPVTVAGVVKSDTTSLGAGPFRTAVGGGANMVDFYLSASGNWRYYAGTEVDSGDAADTNPHVFVAVMNGAASSLWLDGVQIATGNPGASALAAIYVGNDGTVVTPWDGWIGHVLYYSGVLADLAGLSAALRTKWISAANITQRKPTARNDLTMFGTGIVTHAAVGVTTSGMNFSTALGYTPVRKATALAAHAPIAPVAYAPDRKGAKPTGHGPAAVPGYAPARKGTTRTGHLPAAVPGYAPDRKGGRVLAELDAVGNGLAAARKAVTRVGRIDASLLAWPMVSRVATVFEIGKLFVAGVGFAPARTAKAAIGRGDLASAAYSAVKKAAITVVRSDAAVLPFAPSRKGSPQVARIEATALPYTLARTSRVDLARLQIAGSGVSSERKAVARVARAEVGWYGQGQLITQRSGLVSGTLLGAGALTAAHKPAGRGDLGIFGRALVVPARRTSALGELGFFAPATTRRGYLVTAFAPVGPSGRSTSTTARRALARADAVTSMVALERKAITRTGAGFAGMAAYATLKTMRTARDGAGLVGAALQTAQHRSTGLILPGIVGFAVVIPKVSLQAALHAPAFGRAVEKSNRAAFSVISASARGQTTATSTKRFDLARAYAGSEILALTRVGKRTVGKLYVVVVDEAITIRFVHDVEFLTDSPEARIKLGLMVNRMLLDLPETRLRHGPDRR